MVRRFLRPRRYVGFDPVNHWVPSGMAGEAIGGIRKGRPAFDDWPNIEIERRRDRGREVDVPSFGGAGEIQLASTLAEIPGGADCSDRFREECSPPEGTFAQEGDNELNPEHASIAADLLPGVGEAKSVAE